MRLPSAPAAEALRSRPLVAMTTVASARFLPPAHLALPSGGANGRGEISRTLLHCAEKRVEFKGLKCFETLNDLSRVKLPQLGSLAAEFL